MSVLPEFSGLTIELTDHCTSPKLREFVSYWTSKGGADLPTWSDIELMDIYRLAPSVMVKEWIAGENEWKNRFFGSRLAEILGVEATNKLVKDYHRPAETEKVVSFFNFIREQKTPARVHGRCVVKEREYKNLEGVYLPLVDEDGSVRMIMACEEYIEVGPD